MDAYKGFAERYDWWHTGKGNPAREEFYRKLFAEHDVTTVLDCACGTGWNVIMFHSLGFKAFGSDLSDAMLAGRHVRILEKNRSISESRRRTTDTFRRIGRLRSTLSYA